MKIAVYAICKNEELFVERWVESVKEADYIIVGDTGSLDFTLKLFDLYPNVIVHKLEISPFRFDTARNQLLSLVPEDADMCISLDLDEVLVEGWRHRIETAKEADRVSYNYVWKFDSEGNRLVEFKTDKIHSRNNYTWIYPCHETLKYTGEGKERIVDLSVDRFLEIQHHPDLSKSRSSYLQLLALGVSENPSDNRMSFYLAREYYFNAYYAEAEKEFRRYLTLGGWNREKAEAYLYLYKITRDISHLYISVTETPTPSTYFYLGYDLYVNQGNENLIIGYIETSLSLVEDTYLIDTILKSSLPYDILSVTYYKIGLLEKALKYAEKALEIEPANERLKLNKSLLQNFKERQ